MKATNLAHRLAAAAVVLVLTSPAWAAETATSHPATTSHATAPAATTSASAASSATSKPKKKARRDPGLNQPGPTGNIGVTPGPAGNVGVGR